MKKVILGTSICLLLVTLIACSKKAGSTSTSTTSSTDSLSSEAELVVGTFKLEATDNAVTAEQAKALLPLWQTLQKISSSSTTATEEMNALVDQIKSAMTADQVSAITAMKLTQQDMLTVMNDAGLGMAAGGARGTPNPNATPGADMQFFSGGADPGGQTYSSGTGGGPSGSRPSGGGPSGSMPSGGAGGGSAPSGGFVIQGNSDGTGAGPMGAVGTPQAVRGNEFANIVPQPLLNALIELLQKKIQ